MTDTTGSLRGAEHQVVILRPIESFTNAVDGFEQAAANDEKMAGIHVGQQQYRRPVRLELRPVAAPTHVDLVIVAVDDVVAGMIGGVDRDFGERIRAQEIVVIEEREKLAARNSGRGIRRCRDSSVVVAMHDMDAFVGRRPALEALADSGSGAGIVCDAQLPAFVHLIDDAADRLIEEILRRVVDRHDDRDARQAPVARHKFCPQPPQGRLPEFIAREPRRIAIDRLRWNDLCLPLGIRGRKRRPPPRGVRPAAFEPAVFEIVGERIETERLHVGMRGEIPGCLEAGAGIASLGRAVSQVMDERIHAGRAHIRISRTIPFGFEERRRIASFSRAVTAESGPEDSSR